MGEWLDCTGGGSGFVVHPGYILTNRHMVYHHIYGLADAVTVIDPDDPKHDPPIDAKIVAVGDNIDLALLKCEALKAPHVSIRTPSYPRVPAASFVLHAMQGHALQPFDRGLARNHESA